ncbi:amylo-alpha-1,6-glucosidase [Methanospirillum hungatei]|uniref:amylo-alpha-1,6-glucosidase n=1 Tax=Methanospirillum hungatei TaxID=2203 RepID=UPI0026ECFCA8|nr:amylo-alpha-1,6-glucosidase [Methanospirillum hungatei]MCA1916033.1 amylo-alpha-1,6-glucosidase [Methanospirillum hungatei]
MELTDIPRLIRYGRELANPAIASAREFLIPQGDAFSSSSFAGNTRRYHGLYVNRERIILSSLHETINGISLLPGWWGERSPDDSIRHILSAQMYPVSQEISVGKALVTRTIDLHQGLSIRWEVNGTADMVIRPLMTDRSMHNLNSEHQIEVRPVQGGYDWNGYQFRCTLPFIEEYQQYFNARYPKEADRGYDDTEDLISPGFFAGTGMNEVIELEVFPSGLYTLRDSPKGSSSDLLIRASQLCLRNGGILAGYHWFHQEWGRDTFISMPGLLLAGGRYREAEDTFRKFLRHRRGGLIPNRYPDTFNSADGSLWLFWALFHYLQTHHDSPFIDEITPDLESLITSYPETEITSMEHDLISVSPCSTWMDTPSTPREGRPVEVNALWVLALEVCEYLEIGVPVSSKQVRRSFYTFWNEDAGCLYDVRDPDDGSVRPNQLIALALGLMPFDEGRQALDLIQKTLLTPYGLRSLAPTEPGYHGRYAGDPSYHNGMVWPWLMAWYMDALIQYGEQPRQISRVLHPLWQYFLTDGAGMLPEIFDGDFPFAPKGTICQAWSIAELIRGRNTILSLINPQGVE